METINIAAPVTEVTAGHSGLRKAAELLQNGKLVAFPTETVYGLGADARQDEAVAQIFAAKGRPQDNPLIVHIADRSQLEQYTERVPEIAEQLMQQFWPGPLSIVLPVKKGVLSHRVTAGLPTVAVRMPDHPAALELIRLANCPVAAPSANRSGRPSPTQAEHVMDDLNGQIAAVVDSGQTGIGLESTVVIVQADRVHILRPGGVTTQQLAEAGFTVESSSEEALAVDTAPRSPGVKYAHYAPKGRLLLVQGDPEKTVQQRQKVILRVQQEIEAQRAKDVRTAVLTVDEHVEQYTADIVISLGSIDDVAGQAKHLYAALRACDAEQVAFITAEFYPGHDGLSVALANRMLKAAAYNRIQV